MASPNNPDFSLAAKKKIAQATRIALALPQNSGNVTRVARPHSATGLFRVKLNQTGGSEGTATVACSFTYDVIDYWDGTTVIDTGIEVEKDRLLLCAMNAANKGWAYYNKDGDLKIWDCNETAQQNNC